jgi:hypothetical protein
MTAPQVPFTRIAVFGAIGPEPPLAQAAEAQALSPAARAVLERVLASIASSASAIAQPILDRAVEEGTITRSERHALLRELSAPGDPDDAPAPAVTPLPSLGARRVLREALAAIRRAAPGIAQPILDEAVDAERLTPAQEKRILERLRISPSQVLRRPAPGPAVLSA